MSDHLALSVGIDCDFANREPFAELDQPRLANQIDGRGLAEDVDRGASRDRMRDGADLSKNRAASQTPNIVGPEIVPPGRRCLG
jgi:hypothetical protein